MRLLLPDLPNLIHFLPMLFLMDFMPRLTQFLIWVNPFLSSALVNMVLSSDHLFLLVDSLILLNSTQTLPNALKLDLSLSTTIAIALHFNLFDLSLNMEFWS